MGHDLKKMYDALYKHIELDVDKRILNHMNSFNKLRYPEHEFTHYLWNLPYDEFFTRYGDLSQNISDYYLPEFDAIIYKIRNFLVTDAPEEIKRAPHANSDIQKEYLFKDNLAFPTR